MFAAAPARVSDPAAVAAPTDVADPPNVSEPVAVADTPPELPVPVPDNVTEPDAPALAVVLMPENDAMIKTPVMAGAAAALPADPPRLNEPEGTAKTLAGISTATMPQLRLAKLSRLEMPD
jgi:hypothetical protein